MSDEHPLITAAKRLLSPEYYTECLRVQRLHNEFYRAREEWLIWRFLNDSQSGTGGHGGGGKAARRRSRRRRCDVRHTA